MHTFTTKSRIAHFTPFYDLDKCKLQGIYGIVNLRIFVRGVICMNETCHYACRKCERKIINANIIPNLDGWVGAVLNGSQYSGL